jgi:hypothetical protein
MINRLGNFLLLCGLVCLVMFFSSFSFGLDYAVLLFGGIGSLSLGFLLKRGSRKKKKRWLGRKKNPREDENEDL